ncbi:hypothetical protein MTO96_049392 [Rhipicephalus appendiculatus]
MAQLREEQDTADEGKGNKSDLVRRSRLSEPVARPHSERKARRTLGQQANSVGGRETISQGLHREEKQQNQECGNEAVASARRSRQERPPRLGERANNRVCNCCAPHEEKTSLDAAASRDEKKRDAFGPS